LIVGGSSAVGRAFARRAAAAGADLLLAGRDHEDLRRTAADAMIRSACKAQVIDFDAEDFDKHQDFVDTCLGKAEHLNVFLLIGAMPRQQAIDQDFELARRTVQVNYLGSVSLLGRLAPHMEQHGAGRIVVLSSVAGDRGRLKNYVYGSAKGALNLYLQGLRARLCRRGVSVTTVKAGFLDTAMSYGAPGLFLVASPEACAAACWRFAEQRKDVAYFPFFWRGVMAMIRFIPEPVFKRLNI
jgi:short-subunit dehydrogenase